MKNEGVPAQEDDKKNNITSGIAVGVAVGLAALGGKALYDHNNQETQEAHPQTTTQVPLEERSKKDIMKEIVEDDIRVTQLGRIMHSGASALNEPQNMLLEEFLRPYTEAGTMPTQEVMQSEVERLRAEMAKLRARRTVLDVIENASK